MGAYHSVSSGIIDEYWHYDRCIDWSIVSGRREPSEFPMLTSTSTADWWGRRRSLSFGVVIFIIGNIIQVTAMKSWVHMMMGRFVAGLGVGNLSVGVPMFQSECSPREIRGAVVASYQLMITVGILISNIINFGVRNIQDSDASWRIVIGLGIFFSLPLGLGVLVVPESPRWLAGRNDWEGARMAMARLRGMKNDPQNALVEYDLKEMYDIIEKESKAGTSSWLECFSSKSSGIPKLLYRTLLGVAVQFLQQWTGVNVGAPNIPITIPEERLLTPNLAVLFLLRCNDL